jgi:transposase
MWKPEHRLAADRRSERLSSPMMPPAKLVGRKRTIDVREILNGIFYVLSRAATRFRLP